MQKPVEGCRFQLDDVVFGVDADAEEGDGKRPEHSEADPGEWVPAEIHGSQADSNRPDERGGLKHVEHDLTVHDTNPSAGLQVWEGSGDNPMVNAPLLVQWIKPGLEPVPTAA